ncbi:uncharacterized protein L201_007223 [Kwoniella dendrophila CBS 6074]|uniref:Uncharacterized protein n=1 Tax=Kwoniella dendrophila CBS 6074 TaxID=1295534 RepID=A0AAX4K564_9TREE
MPKDQNLHSNSSQGGSRYTSLRQPATSRASEDNSVMAHTSDHRMQVYRNPGQASTSSSKRPYSEAGISSDSYSKRPRQITSSSLVKSDNNELMKRSPSIDSVSGEYLNSDTGNEGMNAVTRMLQEEFRNLSNTQKLIDTSRRRTNDIAKRVKDQEDTVKRTLFGVGSDHHQPSTSGHNSRAFSNDQREIRELSSQDEGSGSDRDERV